MPLNQSDRLILVGGLPGSGKTYLINELVARGWKKFDDFQANALENRSEFDMSCRYQELVADLRAGRGCVVADIRVITDEYRRSAELALRRDVPGISIVWRIYANEPEKCEQNVLRDSRDPQPRIAKIREYTHKHSVPSHVIPIPVGG